MKNIKTMIAAVALACTALSSGATHAQTMTVFHFYTGSTYRTLDVPLRRLYVMGMLDGIQMGAFISNNPQLVSSMAACTSGMNGTQATAIVDKYLGDNPTLWDWPMNVVLQHAFAGACAERGIKITQPPKQ